MSEGRNVDSARGLDRSYICALIAKDYVGLRHLLTRRIGDPQVAADLLHSAGRIVWEKWCAGQLQRPEQIAGCICQVAMNLSRDQRHLSVERPERPTSLAQRGCGRVAAPPAAESEAEERRIAAKLKELIQAVKLPRDRSVLVRFYLRGEDRESICRDLRLDARQFDRILYRMRQRLRGARTYGVTSSDFRATSRAMIANLDLTLANRYLDDRLSEQELQDYEAFLESSPDAVFELHVTAALKVGLARLRETGELDHLLHQPDQSLPTSLVLVMAALAALNIGAIFLRRDMVRNAGTSDLAQIASVAFSACVPPMEPAVVPAADSASLEQMISAREDVMVFKLATDQYVGCLTTTYENLLPRFGGIPRIDQIRKFEALRAELHNGAIARLENVVHRLNEQLRIYEATHPSSRHRLRI